MAHKIPDIVDFSFFLVLTTLFPGIQVTLVYLRAAWEDLSQVTIGHQLREGGSPAASDSLHGHSKGRDHQDTGELNDFWVKKKKREREVLG